MILRQQYLQKLAKLQDKQLIKVVTGVRRCGKSTLLQQFQEQLQQQGVESSQIISINFEKLEYEPLLEYHKLHDFIVERLQPGKTNCFPG